MALGPALRFSLVCARISPHDDVPKARGPFGGRPSVSIDCPSVHMPWQHLCPCVSCLEASLPDPGYLSEQIAFPSGCQCPANASSSRGLHIVRQKGYYAFCHHYDIGSGCFLQNLPISFLSLFSTSSSPPLRLHLFMSSSLRRRLPLLSPEPELARVPPPRLPEKGKNNAQRLCQIPLLKQAGRILKRDEAHRPGPV